MARAEGALITKLLPILDVLDLAQAHLGESGGSGVGDAAGADAGAEGKALEQARTLLLDALSKEGLERIDQAEVDFDPVVHDAVSHLPAEEAGGPDTGAGMSPDPGEPSLPGSGRCCGRATAGAVRRCGRRWSRCAAEPGAPDGVRRKRGSGSERWRHSVSGSRRTTTRCSAWPRRPRTRRSAAPTGSWPRSCTLTRNPGAEDRFKEITAAYEVLGDADKRKEYDEVRRLGPMAGGFGSPAASGVRAASAGPEAGPSGSRTWATWAISSAASSAAAGPAAAVPGVPSVGRTSRRSCTCRSRTPSTG